MTVYVRAAAGSGDGSAVFAGAGLAVLSFAEDFFAFDCGLKAFSFNRIKVGFRPSTIPMIPSRIISRISVAWRMRARSLLPAGRKRMLADPTPYTVATNATAMPCPDRQ